MRLRAAVPALALVLSLALLEHASGGSAFLLPAFVPSPRPSSAGPFRRGTVLEDAPQAADALRRQQPRRAPHVDLVMLRAK